VGLEQRAVAAEEGGDGLHSLARVRAAVLHEYAPKPPPPPLAGLAGIARAAGRTEGRAFLFVFFFFFFEDGAVCSGTE
jgi:hypothetical protein